MLAVHRARTLGADPPDLKSCASDPLGCSADTLAQILEAVQCGCPPQPEVMTLLSQGLDKGDPVIGTNPFFGNVGVIRAIRANAPANPNIAIVVLVKVLDQMLEFVPVAEAHTDFITEAIKVLAENIPKAQAESQARGILKLKDITGLKSLPTIVNAANEALVNLPRPTTPTTTTPPQTPSSGFVLSDKAKTALLIAGAVAAVGGSAFLLWRVGRVPRTAIAARRRRRH